ncbi:DNA-directed RNA polymerase III, subunit Rpc31 [Mycena floridula]|nr:DNA-directed RNA polymerase III, subunit Rpc31 [Mycena floridula]
MSRGARGGGRGRGRGGPMNALLPFGVSASDIKMEGTALYPPMRPPVLIDFSEDEQRICQYQMGFVSRLRNSQYYLVETTKSTELPRYSDKYKPSATSQPKLKRADLHAPFFPSEIFETYFNPRKKRKARPVATSARKRMNLDEMADEDEEKDPDAEGGSDVGSQGPASDYDVDEEYDNDYAGNYFENGEGDDMDDLGDGGGGGDEGGGGGGDYD